MTAETAPAGLPVGTPRPAPPHGADCSPRFGDTFAGPGGTRTGAQRASVDLALGREQSDDLGIVLDAGHERAGRVDREGNGCADPGLDDDPGLEVADSPQQADLDIGGDAAAVVRGVAHTREKSDTGAAVIFVIVVNGRPVLGDAPAEDTPPGVRRPFVASP